MQSAGCTERTALYRAAENRSGNVTDASSAGRRRDMFAIGQEDNLLSLSPLEVSFSLWRGQCTLSPDLLAHGMAVTPSLLNYAKMQLGG